ncbi:MAG: Dihydrodipicolinate synthase [Thermoleophilia bacterium]|nr:Dihydrodipicolinate synthase [Thermoleophilia bacterium]
MYTGFGTIVTAAVTPFGADGSIDHDEWRRLLRHLEATGSDAVVVAGTTGESPTISDEEKLELVRSAVDELAGRLRVIAGTGSNDTRHAVELTRRAVEAGADGILVVSPYYNNPPREGLVRHFTAVCRAAGDTPVMLYNVPARTVVNLEPDLVAELAQLPNVVALKQANPELGQFVEIRSLAPDLAIYAGNDDTLLPMLAEGAVGVVSVASHVIGDRMQRVVELWREGREAEARELADELGDVIATINTLTTNPIPVKAALQLLGFEVGPPRLPLVEATGMQRERIRAMLERHELVATHA